VDDNIYLKLTREFNAGRLRAVISSGQAVVLHRLAVMSKDGDWILREEPAATTHILEVLERHGARYRFGAPLDVRWLRGGWSSHLEFADAGLRVRTDFVTRPPRINPARLERLWRAAEGQDPPVVPLPELAELKKTNREKDYAVIGELARRMEAPEDVFRYSRSARDLLEQAAAQPELAAQAAADREALRYLDEGREALESALDAERRRLVRANEERLSLYMNAAADWRQLWSSLEAELRSLSLRQAHERMVHEAASCLPEVPSGIDA
jgi:hypothetical protein